MKDKIIGEIKEALNGMHERWDYTDVGDAIGAVIARNKSKKLGFEVEDFESGFDHGVSVIEGAHG